MFLGLPQLFPQAFSPRAFPPGATKTRKRYGIQRERPSVDETDSRERTARHSALAAESSPADRLLEHTDRPRPLTL